MIPPSRGQDGGAGRAKVPPEALASLSERLPFPPPKPRSGKRSRWARRRNRRAGEPRVSREALKRSLLAFGRGVLVGLKVVAAVAAVSATAVGARAAIDHVVRSPRFAVREIAISPTSHAPRELIVAIAGVAPGDRLLALDIERIERRLLRLPWIASARVRRSLPSTLVVDLTERRAAATALLGGLYLVDETGHPFKKATSAEAADLVTLTGLSRGLFVSAVEPAEAAFREALSLLAMYQRPTARGQARPPLSEIRVDPRAGYTLVLLDGGTEVPLGRDGWAGRLTRFDLLNETLGTAALTRLRQVHLDGPNLSRVPVLPLPAPDVEADAGSKSADPPRPGGKAADERARGPRAGAQGNTPRTQATRLASGGGAEP